MDPRGRASKTAERWLRECNRFGFSPMATLCLGEVPNHGLSRVEAAVGTWPI